MHAVEKPFAWNAFRMFKGMAVVCACNRQLVTVTISLYTIFAIPLLDAKVGVALQTPSGERLQKEFASTETLLAIFDYWKQQSGYVFCK